MNLKSMMRFVKRYYFILGIVLCVLFVGLVSFYKLFISKPVYVYAKVKLGQGLWWAQTAKPNIWMVDQIKKGDSAKGLSGRKIIEVLSVTHYPVWGSDQFDTYLSLKLKVSQQKTTKSYLFNRDTLAVGSPVDLSFPTFASAGTVTQLSESPLNQKLEEKIITLVKRLAFPWEYDAIQIGDSYFDGESKVFEILDKKYSDSTAYSTESVPNLPAGPEARRYIEIKARIKVIDKDNQLVFGEEQIIRKGKGFNISTFNFAFNDYIISKVE